MFALTSLFEVSKCVTGSDELRGASCSVDCKAGPSDIIEDGVNGFSCAVGMGIELQINGRVNSRRTVEKRLGSKQESDNQLLDTRIAGTWLSLMGMR